MLRSPHDWLIAALATAVLGCGGSSGNGSSGVTAPKPPVVTSVLVSPSSVTLLEGQTATFSATARDGTGAQISSVALVWGVTDGAVASLSSAGVLTALHAGTTSVTASSGSVSGTASVIVKQVPIASVKVSPATATISPGDTIRLTATALDSVGGVLAGRPFTWTVSDPNSATVASSGLVTAVRAGTIQVTASAEGRSGSMALTIAARPVASVSITPSAPTLSVGHTVQLTTTVRDALGTALTDRTVAYASSNTVIAGVSATGLVTGHAPGTATITATSEGRQATALVTVAGSVTDLLPHYSFGETIGSVKVFSDISATFTHDHVVNLDQTWRYYAEFFGATPGSHFEMYYTRDSATYVATFPYCPAIYFVNARQVNSCYNVYGDGAWIEFVIPYVTPDFGTQYHEVSHLFLNRVHHDAENYPWLKEGSGMYFESGSFDGAGIFSVATPLLYIREGFHHYDAAGGLISLGTLLFEARNDFYAGLYGGNGVREYAQSGLFFTYLMKSYPTVMHDLFDNFRRGQLSSNAEVVNFILAQTGRSIAQLEGEYIAYGRALP